MLEDDAAPPADSRITSGLDPCDLVAIEKPLVEEDSSRICDERIFSTTTVASFFH
jgi:hypothetical protein